MIALRRKKFIKQSPEHGHGERAHGTRQHGLICLCNDRQQSAQFESWSFPELGFNSPFLLKQNAALCDAKQSPIPRAETQWVEHGIPFWLASTTTFTAAA